MTASLFGSQAAQSHSTVGHILAAYDPLVLNFAPTQTDINRYEASKDYAELGRNLLIDVEVLDERDTAQNGELERWLAQVEGDIEGYRKAYRELTGVGLAALGMPAIEQDA
jgi:hypothetical protein